MAHPVGRRLLRALLFVAVWLTATAAAPPPSAGETAFREARAIVDRRDWTAAEKAVDQALLRFPSLDDDWHWALVVLRAEVLNSEGRPTEVLKSLPDLPAHLQHSRTAVHRLVQLATAHYRLDQHEIATRLFSQAESLAKKKHPRLLPEVLNYITGSIEWGRPRKAEITARKAMRLAQLYGDELAELDAMYSISAICIRQERFVEGVHWLEKALPRASALQIFTLVERGEGDLGFAYLSLGDSERAMQHFVVAEAEARRIGAVTDRVRWLIEAGNVRLDREDYDGARNDYLTARDLATDSENLGVIAANLSSTSLELGLLDDAYRYNQEALARKNKLNDPEAILNSRVLEARIAALRGHYDEGEELLGDVAEQSIVPSTRWEAKGWLADLLAQTGRDELADAQFRAALASARSARASIPDEELRLSFLRVFDDIVDRYLTFLVDRNRTDEALEVVEEGRGLSLEEGLGLPTKGPKLNPKALAARLHATLLCYRLGRTRSYLWVVTSKGVTPAILPPRRQIQTAVDAYQREVVGPRGSLELSSPRGSELYRMLVPPAAGPIPRDSLVIVVPDGRLGFMNFETLIVPTPKRHYWIDDVVVANAFSLQLLGRTHRKSVESPSLLLIGNPPTVDPAFPALKRAGDEIAYVEKRFEPHRSLTLKGEKATPDAYKSVSPELFDYIHFVAHGESTRTRPLDSAVILARGASGYKLQARDIARRRLRLHARLVTISSCHGAGVDAYVGEGLVGLAWAFLRAGADNVVASLWDVIDAATPELMDRMYAGIQKGRPAAMALRDAKRAATGIYRRPRYWAPFIFYIGS
jgi:CHAT domain-containing protein